MTSSRIGFCSANYTSNVLPIMFLKKVSPQYKNVHQIRTLPGILNRRVLKMDPISKDPRDQLKKEFRF